MTLDDGSGACIDVRITRKPVTKVVAGESNTDVKNLQVHSYLGCFELVVDGKGLDIGTVVKAKCTISSFRDTRQLVLKRISIIKNTNEEVAAWRETAGFKKDVLSKPWVLTSEERDSIDRKKMEDEQALRDGEKRFRAETRARNERHAKRAQKLNEHDERAERRRKERETRYNAGALPGSDMIYYNW